MLCSGTEVFIRAFSPITARSVSLCRMNPQSPSRISRLSLVFAPLFGLALGFGSHYLGLSWPAAFVAGLTLWVAAWWVFEPIPIPFTSLLPLALLPLFGVLGADDVAKAYGNPLILLLLGGFMLSQSLEKSGVHKRIALGMIRRLKSFGPRGLVVGFTLAAAALSMWISNTATCLMLLPIALACLHQMQMPQLTVPLLLGVAYGASIGGMGTPIGTPPNLIFIEIYRLQTGIAPGFLTYMSWALPVIVVMLPIVIFWLTRHLKSGKAAHVESCGAWRSEEKRVLLVFAFVALAWVTRSEPFGGWKTWLALPQANDASVAFVGCILMALIPSKNAERGAGDRLLTWDYAVRIPWGILILFGSGIAIAEAFMSSGLSTSIGAMLGGAISTLPIFVVLLLIALCVTFLTEITSNTATASLLMPIMAAAAIGAGIDPKVLMLVTALSASCAFMLPVATGPNAVIYGSGQLTTAQMAREGLIINLIGALIISSVVWLQHS